MYKDYGTIHQKKLTELGTGDYFGEMGLIDSAPRSATAVVIQDGTKLDRIGEAEFGQFLAEHPKEVELIIQQLSHKLRQTTRDYLEICQSVARVTGNSTDIAKSHDYRFDEEERLRSIHDSQTTAAGNS